MNKNAISFYSKSGVLFTILPYYGRYDSWERLLTLTWKQSKRKWEDNRTAFTVIEKSIEWRVCSEELQLWYLKHLSKKIKFKDNMILSLNMKNKNEVIFLKQASQFRCPNFNLLKIEGIRQDDNLRVIINKFFKNFIPKCISNFMFQGEENFTITPLSLYKIGLMKIFPIVISITHLKNFLINQEWFTDILKHSNCRSLFLENCVIEISKDFELDPLQKYKIKKLILIGSTFKKSNSLQNFNKFDPISDIIQSLSMTNLKTDLESVLFDNDNFDINMQQILKTHGMKASWE